MHECVGASQGYHGASCEAQTVLSRCTLKHCPPPPLLGDPPYTAGPPPALRDPPPLHHETPPSVPTPRDPPPTPRYSPLPARSSPPTPRYFSPLHRGIHPPFYTAGPTPPKLHRGTHPPSYTAGPTPPKRQRGTHPPSYTAGPTPPKLHRGTHRPLFFPPSFISLIADGPHRYQHPACGHKGSSNISPVHALIFFYHYASSALLQLVNQWLHFTYSRSHAFRYEHKFYFGKTRTHDFRTSRDGGYLLDHSGDERLHRGTHPPSYTAGPNPLPTPRDSPPLHYTAGPTPLPTPRNPPHQNYTAGPTPLPTPRAPPHQNYTAGPTPLTLPPPPFSYLTYSRWTSSLPSCLWSQRIFPYVPGSRLTFFYRYASSAFLQLVNRWLHFTYSRSHVFRYEHKFYLGKTRAHDFRTSRDGGYLLDHSGLERLHRGTHPPSYTAGPNPLPTPRDPPPPHYTAGPTPLPTPRDPTHQNYTAGPTPPKLHRGTHPPLYIAGPTPSKLHRGTPPPHFPPPPSFISLIADGPHHYHPACSHKEPSHLSPVYALQPMIGGYLLDHSGDERLHRGTHPPPYTAGPTSPKLHRGTHPPLYTAGPTPPKLHRGTHPPSYTVGPPPLHREITPSVPTPRDPPPYTAVCTPPCEIPTPCEIPPPYTAGSTPLPTPRDPPHQNYTAGPTPHTFPPPLLLSHL